MPDKIWLKRLRELHTKRDKIRRKLEKQRAKVKKQQILVDSYISIGKRPLGIYEYNLVTMTQKLYSLEAMDQWYSQEIERHRDS